MSNAVNLPVPPSTTSGRVATLLAGACLSACFPRDDLEGYSEQWSLAAAGGIAGALGSNGGNGAAGASGGGGAGASASGGAAGNGGEGGGAMPPPDDDPDAGMDTSRPDAANTDLPDESPDAEPPPPPDPPEELACQSAGGVVDPGRQRCLVVRESASNFGNAANDCDATWSGSLVKIADVETDSLITQLLLDENAGDAWIGLASANRGDPAQIPGPLLWPDGDAYQLGVDFDNWGTDQPDAFAGQFCVEKRIDQPPGAGDPVGAWYDQPCTGLKAHVCERTLASLP